MALEAIGGDEMLDVAAIENRPALPPVLKQLTVIASAPPIRVAGNYESDTELPMNYTTTNAYMLAWLVLLQWLNFSSPALRAKLVEELRQDNGEAAVRAILETVFALLDLKERPFDPTKRPFDVYDAHGRPAM